MSKIYLFNSGHEQEVLYDSPSYTLPERSTRISQDFELIPLWYARSSDFVLVAEAREDDFCKGLKKIGFVVPSVITYSDLNLLQLTNQSFSIVPWGISSAVISRIRKNIDSVNDSIHVPVYNKSLLNINSRLFAIDVLRKIKEQGFLPSTIDIPQVFDDFDTLVEYIKMYNNEVILVKSPYSSSGIGLLWIREGLERSETQILKGFFKRQKCVVVEKVYTKIIDFALEYIYEKDTFQFRGISLFSTNYKGAYQGNVLRSQQYISAEICKYIPVSVLDEIKNLYVEILNQYCEGMGLSCIGIDMMIIQTEEGYALHPCVEINPRYNMGYLAVEFFDKHVVNTSSGFFQVLYADTATLIAFEKEQQDQHPISMIGNRLEKGFLSMNPILDFTKYLLYAIIEDSEAIQS